MVSNTEPNRERYVLMKASIYAILFLAVFAPSVHAQSNAEQESIMKSTKDIILEFFGTFTTDEGWEPMLAADMTFGSPMDETNSKEEFIPLDKQFRQLVVSASVKWIISEGDQASALVNYKMVLPSGDTLNIEFSEIIKVEAQKISSIKVFFDTAKFNEFLSKISESTDR